VRAPLWPLITADWNFWPEGRRGEEVIALIRRLGFSGVEIGTYSAADLAVQRLHLAHWKRVYEVSLPVVLFSLPAQRWPLGGLASAEHAVRDRVVEEARAIAGIARDLGAGILGVWLGADRLTLVEDFDLAWRRTVEGMRTIAAAAADLNLTVAVEYKPGEVVGGADAFLRLVDAVGAANLGLLLDTGHALYGREDLEAVLKRCGRRLVHIHLDDNYGDSDRDLPPGTVHNFEPFFRHLQAVGYRGALSFDLYYGVVNEGLSAAAACQQSKAYVESILHRLDQGSSA